MTSPFRFVSESQQNMVHPTPISITTRIGRIVTAVCTFLIIYNIISRFVDHPSTTTSNITPTSTPTPPHIIMIMVDDLGWNGFSLQGHNTEVHTPFLEELAQGGILLQNYYVYKFCSPSRAALLTGRVPGHGIWEVNPSDTAQVGINFQTTMISQLLKEKANYSTHQVGKWHQGFYAPRYLPTGRGFDTSFGFLMAGCDHFNSCHACPNQVTRPPSYSNVSRTCPANERQCNVTCPQEGGVDLWRNDAPAIGENGTYTAYLWSKEAVRVIAANAAQRKKATPNSQDDKPMFMYLALHNVHQPVESPDEFLEPYPAEDYNSSTIPRRYYNAMAFSVDEVIRNVTTALKENGMYNNSVIVISTDNGGTYEHLGAVPGSSNYPLRGFKYTYFEGGVRGLAMVHSPLLPKQKHGTKTSTLLHVTDWYVTFCKLAGIEDCRDGFDQVAPLDGINAWDILTTESGESSESPPRPPSSWADRGGPGRDEVLLGVGHGQDGALRKGDYKLIVGASRVDGWSAQYPGSTPIKPPPSDGPACSKQPCLFNVKEDPREEHDLAEEMPNLADELLRRYQELVNLMDVPNGYEDRFDQLVWNGAYHVPRVVDFEACQAMRDTGFWRPWKSNEDAEQQQQQFTKVEFPEDGPAARFPSDAVLI